jgi:hypothetical protein
MAIVKYLVKLPPAKYEARHMAHTCEVCDSRTAQVKS